MIHSPYSVFPYQYSPRPLNVAPPPSPQTTGRSPVLRKLLGGVAIGVAVTAPLLVPAAAAQPPAVCRVATAGLAAQERGVPLSGAQQTFLAQAAAPSACDSPAAVQARQQLEKAVHSLTADSTDFSKTVAKLNQVGQQLEPWTQKAPGTYPDGKATVRVEVTPPHWKGDKLMTHVTRSEESNLQNLTIQGDYRSIGEFDDGVWAGSVTYQEDGGVQVISRVDYDMTRSTLHTKDTLIHKQGSFEVEKTDEKAGNIQTLTFDGKNTLQRSEHPQSNYMANKLPHHTAVTEEFVIAADSLTARNSTTDFNYEKATFVDTETVARADGGAHVRITKGTGSDYSKHVVSREDR